MSIRREKTTKKVLQDQQPVGPVPEPAGIKYTMLGDAGKLQILRERALRLEAEHFQHATNLELAESHVAAGGNADQLGQQIAQSKTAMVLIEQALATVETQIKALE